MPSIRVVIASNANRTNKTVVLVPTLEADLFEFAIDIAKKKLRVKGKRVFRESASGTEVISDQVKISDISNDEYVVIS